MPFWRHSFAAALAVAGAVISVGPSTANAASVGSVGFAGIWESEITDPPAAPMTATLSFDNLVTFIATGIFAGYEATLVEDLDLMRTSVSLGGGAAVADYAIDTTDFTGESWKVYENAVGDVITFDLDLDATWQRTFAFADSSVNWQQGPNAEGVFEYTGIYNLPDGSTVVGSGELNASASGTAQTFQVTQVAVPLPAGVWLLGSGGLVLGAMRLRKRAA